MESWLAWFWFGVAAVGLGIHGAYYGALADACLKIGRSLEGAVDGTTGFQDAITPPASSNARLLNWLATLLMAGGSWYDLGLSGMVTFLAIRLFATIIPGAMLKTDPPGKHFCRKIHASMSRREADFAKMGDSMRARAMGDLRARFERSSHADRLAE